MYHLFPIIQHLYLKTSLPINIPNIEITCTRTNSFQEKLQIISHLRDGVVVSKEQQLPLQFSPSSSHLK